MVVNAVTGTQHRTQGFTICVLEMGDRGFTVRDLLEERRVNLIMPAFTRKGCQLTNEEVTHTLCIAHAWIHVEWAIRCLKVYKILSQTLPINLVPKMYKMLKICAVLKPRQIKFVLGRNIKYVSVLKKMFLLFPQLNV